MKVIYEKNIFEKINDAISEAAIQNKKIEYIEVTRQEAEIIYDNFVSKIMYGFPKGFWTKETGLSVTDRKCKEVHNSKYMDILIKVEGY